jgi:hypothetical protein
MKTKKLAISSAAAAPADGDAASAAVADGAPGGKDSRPNVQNNKQPVSIP